MRLEIVSVYRLGLLFVLMTSTQAARADDLRDAVRSRVALGERRSERKACKFPTQRADVRINSLIRAR